MDYNIKVERIYFERAKMRMTVSGFVKCDLKDADYIPKAKPVLYFLRETEDRRIPFVYSEYGRKDGGFWFKGEYTYLLRHLFWKTRETNEKVKMVWNLFCGNEYEEEVMVDYSETVITEKRAQYEYSVDGSALYLQRKEKYTKPISPALRVLQVPWNFCRMCVGVILIPWYVLEALASFAGLFRLEESITNPNPMRRIIGHVNLRLKKIGGRKISIKKMRKRYFAFFYHFIKKNPTIPNRITFISQRRDEVSGNFAFVYEKLKEVPGLDIRFWFNNKNPQDMTVKEIKEFCQICAESKTIVLDEYTPEIHYFPLKPEVKIVQLWHACGAFKTFGFTRLGKPMGSPQATKMHRNYDYVTVSSSFCKLCHSEGFGIATDRVVPTGIPRTDIFFDAAYKKKVQDEFYAKYPGWRDKKIIMFAPTFRGMVREEAFYPMKKFRVDQVMDALGNEYAMIIKHHPFVTKAHPIPEQYTDRVVDFSDNAELNDLMFVCDVIITDYSSLIFEASLLKIPMLFYVFDLEEYIEDRDFYFDLKLMSPGKLAYTQQELIDAIKTEDYGLDKMEEFTKLFFDNPDGKASERVANLILETIKGEE